MLKIEIFDSTLRDGMQCSGIDFSVLDKINIVKLLDDFGVDYIEVGNPGYNYKDFELFNLLENYTFKHSKIVAFGSTRKKSIRADEDECLIKLVSCPAEYLTIFGKCSELHIREVLNVTPEENLNIIKDSISYCINNGKHVFFDAEHFFDAYKNNKGYAIKSLKAAASAGAEKIILCDTNGACFPEEIYTITKEVLKEINLPVGIHCHNDTDCATANSLAAINAGAVHVQGTFLGYGERCGNANLSALIPNLQLKLKYNCVPDNNIKKLTETARHIAEISNIIITDNSPYIGKNAFSHKAGMHIDAVLKNSLSFEHISPEEVGNQRNIVISEVSGRAAVSEKIKRIAPELKKDSIEVKQILDLLKQQEYLGYKYEAAAASFELMVLKYLGKLTNFFSVDYYKIFADQTSIGVGMTSAIVKVRVGENTQITASEGHGPVNAIDTALRQALLVFYPELDKIHLVDYKVRVMDSNKATAAIVRVLIETSDGNDIWTTVGASQDIIEASFIALKDSLMYKLQCLNEKEKYYEYDDDSENTRRS